MFNLLKQIISLFIVTGFTSLIAQYAFSQSIDVFTGSTPVIDGVNSTGEWDDAGSEIVPSVSAEGSCSEDAEVYVKHNNANLYVALYHPDHCFGGAIVLIDCDHDHADSPQPDDRAFFLCKDCGSTVPISEHVGTGSSWSQVTPSGWEGEIGEGDTYAIAEFKIPFSIIGIVPGVAKTLGVSFNLGGEIPWEYVWPEGSATGGFSVGFPFIPAGPPNLWGDLTSPDNWYSSDTVEEEPLLDDDGFIDISELIDEDEETDIADGAVNDLNVDIGMDEQIDVSMNDSNDDIHINGHGRNKGCSCYILH